MLQIPATEIQNKGSRIVTTMVTVAITVPGLNQVVKGLRPCLHAMQSIP